MNRIFSFLSGALAGAGVLAAVASVVTHLTEESLPEVTDVAANRAPNADDPSLTADNRPENA